MSQKKSNIFKKRHRYIEKELEGGLGEIDLLSFIYKWSNTKIVDRLWREKYKVAFNSPRHREVTVIDQMIDIGQDLVFFNILKNPFKNKYIPGRGKYLRKHTSQEVSVEEIEEAFNSIDIENLEYDEKGNLIL